jgi:hypothetical protein
MHSNNQSVVVRHREYIADVYSDSAFDLRLTYALNPGLATSFPWLSTIAGQYQEYTWKGIIYEYISTSGDAVSSTNNALGSVIMATQYRSTAPAFFSKQQMLNNYFSCDAKPSESFCHPIECNPKENPYNVQYVRTGAVPSGEDAKTYDLGEFMVAVQGMQASNIDVGELWVSYEVELRKPVLTGAIGNEMLYASYTNTSPASNAPLGNGTATLKQDNIGLVLTSQLLSIPAGSSAKNYLVLVRWSACTAFVGSTLTITNGTIYDAQAVADVVSTYSVGTGSGVEYGIVQVTDQNIACNISFGNVTVTGSTLVTIHVIEVPSYGPTGAAFPTVPY